MERSEQRGRRSSATRTVAAGRPIEFGGMEVNRSGLDLRIEVPGGRTAISARAKQITPHQLSEGDLTEMQQYPEYRGERRAPAEDVGRGGHKSGQKRGQAGAPNRGPLVAGSECHSPRVWRLIGAPGSSAPRRRIC